MMMPSICKEYEYLKPYDRFIFHSYQSLSMMNVTSIHSVQGDMAPVKTNNADASANNSNTRFPATHCMMYDLTAHRSG